MTREVKKEEEMEMKGICCRTGMQTLRMTEVALKFKKSIQIGQRL